MIVWFDGRKMRSKNSHNKHGRTEWSTEFDKNQNEVSVRLFKNEKKTHCPVAKTIRTSSFLALQMSGGFPAATSFPVGFVGASRLSII
jgi:hypothetical protein